MPAPQRLSTAGVIVGDVAAPPTEEGQADTERPRYRWNVADGIYVITHGDKTVEIDFSVLPAGAHMKPRQVYGCDSGVTKTAWAIMTEPQEV